MSKPKRKKKSDKQIERLTQYINLAIAILELLTLIGGLLIMLRSL